MYTHTTKIVCNGRYSCGMCVMYASRIYCLGEKVVITVWLLMYKWRNCIVQVILHVIIVIL